MKTTMRFEEDDFDLDAHKKAADDVRRKKAHNNHMLKQIKRGKIIVAFVTIAAFFVLFYIAAELGLMQMF